MGFDYNVERIYFNLSFNTAIGSLIPSGDVVDLLYNALVIPD